VSVFIRKDQCFKKIDALHYCEEQMLEICAVQLETKTSNIIICLNRAPSGDFNQFIKRLDVTSKYLYNPKSEFLICGDINTDHLTENNQRKQLIIYNTEFVKHCKFCYQNSK
jgi:hypothetical protein